MKSNYRTELSPWAIYRWIGIHAICIARFRRRGEAEEYLKLLRREVPSRMKLIFDLPSSAYDQTNNSIN